MKDWRAECSSYFFVDDAISVEVRWFEEGRPRLGLSKLLAGVDFEALGERGTT